MKPSSWTFTDCICRVQEAPDAGAITDAWYPVADSLIEDRRACQLVESVEWINLHVEVRAPNLAYVMTKYEFNATEMSGEAVAFTYRRLAEAGWPLEPVAGHELAGMNAHRCMTASAAAL